MGGFYGWRDVEEEHVFQLLGALKKLYADPNKWIPWPLATDEHGKEVHPNSIDAMKWSLLGAGEMCSSAIFAQPLADYIECAVRDYLDDLSKGEAIHGLSYADEYALICLGYEHLTAGDNNDQQH